MLIPAHVRDRSVDDEIILSVIIPAYNEESIIESTLLSVHHFFAEMNFMHEVIVVDDGSTDETAGAVSSLMDAMPELVLISLPENRGKGAAVREG
ncbi:MAG: glycosyltransferase, partial [Candidatus Dadabacteria bacterium]|nr:glycosyltransferase [Candidatus Dadabacteria bacterium]